MRAFGGLLLLPMVALVPLAAALCPQRCRCDDTALEADCTDAALDSFPISLNPRLRRLRLAGNDIAQLDRSMMVSSYKALELLDLGGNGLRDVQLGSFAQQGQLRELRLGGNRLSRLDRDVFAGLRQLRVLDLSGNQLRQLTAGLLQPLPLLEDLSLAENALQQLPAAAAAGAVSLRRLRLAGNQLRRAPAAAVAQLPQLEALDLSFNRIAQLRGAELAAARPQLAQLNLAGNPLHQLGPRTFSGLGALRRLVLSDTKLTELDAAAFEPLVSLEELFLDANPLRELRSAPLQALLRLRLLSLRGCPQLVTLQSDAFSHSRALEEVLIEDNPALASVPGGLFMPALRLRRLSLRGNALTSLPEDAYSWRRVRADLSDNPWQCACALRWLAELAENATTGGATCAGPAALRGRPVHGLSPAELRCGGAVRTATLALAVGIPSFLAVLALLAAALLAFRHRRSLRKRFKAFRWRDHVRVGRKEAPPTPGATYYYRDTYYPGGDGDGRLVPVTEL